MRREWLMRRNCSLSPAQAGAVYGVLVLAMLAIGLGFAVQGLWFVLAFAVLDAAAVLAALLCYARHAVDRERIALADGILLIERTHAGAVERTELDPCWTTVDVPRHPRTRVELAAGGVTIEVGIYVCEQGKRQLARELRQALLTHPF